MGPGSPPWLVGGPGRSGHPGPQLPASGPPVCPASLPALEQSRDRGLQATRVAMISQKARPQGGLAMFLPQGSLPVPLLSDHRY